MKRIFTMLVTVLYISSNAQTGVITTVAGTGTAGFSGDGGLATAAKLNNPLHGAVDASGNLYIPDNMNNRIRIVNTSGIISTYAGTGTQTPFSGDGGQATAANLYTPLSVSFDAAGNVYIADEDHFCIRKVTPSGIISTVAGIGNSYGYTGDGVLATTTKFSRIYGVTSDAAGNLYIADTENDRIRKVDAASGIVTTIAGNGTQGYTGDGGLATSAELNRPYKVVLDNVGNLYIADTYNSVVRKVNASTGIITTIAGTGTGGYSGDGGLATSAMLYQAGDVAWAGGEVFIADAGNNRIRKINASGIITTIVGTGAASSTGDGGQATIATINEPSGVSFDSNGNLFVTESNGNRVRKVNSVAKLCSPQSVNDTTTYYVSSAGFQSISPQFQLKNTDTLATSTGGCDSLLNHYIKYVFNANNCTNTTYDTVTVTVTDTLIINRNPTGINPVTYENTIKIYPNPTSDVLNMNFGANYATMSGYTLKILNGLSQTMYSTVINTQNTSVNISSWANGVYFVYLLDASSNTVDLRKIVIQ